MLLRIATLLGRQRLPQLHNVHQKYLKCVQIHPVSNQFHRLYSVSPMVQNQTESSNVVDPNEEKKIKILELEMSVWRQEGRKVPDPENLKPHHWIQILNLGSSSARKKYYAFLWQIEKKKESSQEKKKIKEKENFERSAKVREDIANNNHIVYGLTYTNYLLRIYDTTINLWNNNKLTRAMQFGQKLVIDCSYDEHMIPREAVNTAKQLMLCFAENRFHDEPFDLYFCNANMNGITMSNLLKHIPTMMEAWFPLNVHSQSYLDIFPKEQLVYLTPHCRNDLDEYNHDDIYIIGAMVDKINNEPLSLAKAKRLGLRMARLPLDKYLQWGAGSGKSLTLNQMTNILLDAKKTNGNWNKALQHVPRRKINFNEGIDREEEKLLKVSRSLKFNVNTWGNSATNQIETPFSKKKIVRNSNLKKDLFKDIFK